MSAAAPDTTPATLAFIARWTAAQAAERANYVLFLTELCDILGVDRPEPSGPDTENNAYVFERAVTFHHRIGTTSNGRIDLYKRGAFVLEAKQYAAPKPTAPASAELLLDLPGSASAKSPRIARNTAAWDDAMFKALGQAERYARALPAAEEPPPFLLVVDVGHVIELYADFTQKGKAYLPFPDARSHRIRLADLARPEMRERLRLVWTNPTALDPAKISARVTREVAGYLAELAKSFEKNYDAKLVSEFLTRCLFCMFAEDVGLLPDKSFQTLLDSVKADPGGAVPLLEGLFREMNTGGYSLILRQKLLYFNGGLFASATALKLNAAQLGLLRSAAHCEWRHVEPAIFGTLLERALSPDERHKLGAHYTPRSYVERLVLPTLIEPLRDEWDTTRAVALIHTQRGDMKTAIAEVRTYHRHLCAVRVLDPACGSGNFLYVALEHMKRLEGEVLSFLHDLGDTEDYLNLQSFTVDPHQFLGIELNPRAAAIAELVLWIGYLQWHFRVHGQTMPAEPVLRKFHNIENRDAVLAYDKKDFAKTPDGKVRFVWDRRSFKTDPTTRREVPDEQKVIPLETFSNARPASWPVVEYIVGNPPFLGASRMREDLGDGYVETLRALYPEIPESVDFVMLWWHKAARLVATGRALRFGFITTNSIRQTFNRRVVQDALDNGVALDFAIPDHPWIDAASCAAVRIAMTVGIPSRASTEHVSDSDMHVEEPPAHYGSGSKKMTDDERTARIKQLAEELKKEPPPRDKSPRLYHIATENPGPYGEYEVTLDLIKGLIAADLSNARASVAGTKPLMSNEGLANRGFCLFGSGFIISTEEAKALGLGKNKAISRYIRPYRNGKDLTDKPRGVMVIDLFGLSADEIRKRFPKVYQHVVTTVKPERDQNKRESRRKNWWIFGEPNKEMRRMVADLPRYIATVETAKHRFFQFLDADILPDNMLVVIASDDAFHLGVLSSRFHGVYALAAGGDLGGNTPRYNKTRCFDPFPFPACMKQQKDRIRHFAEAIDTHRKRAQKEFNLGLTEIYNVVAKLRTGEALTAHDKALINDALIITLRHLHDELDAAVADAYGWPAKMSDIEILERIVALNTARVTQEAEGLIRWLRPDYQKPLLAKTEQTALDITEPAKRGKSRPASAVTKRPAKKLPWPKTSAARIKTVESIFAATSAPLTAEAILAQLTRAKPDEVHEILEALTTLGRIHPGDTPSTYIQ